MKKEDRSMGGVVILEGKHFRDKFYPEGLSKVKKGDVFYVVDPPGGEGHGPLRMAAEDPVRKERIGADGKIRYSWSIKTDPNFDAPF